ncbi:ABC-type lipoprotein export system ATPase subunit/ABC-type lipoprotein release transport system permease subunit [Weissella uvarum]|uniref:ABC transporter ATP-binding protein/permease n=1 Tax=Weissella uvarum TaxID=1479233 RepID=UPI0019619722|nr:ABC transporter ATP-binding protein/permease [Weissella uvarum]MBM7616992.1 ABC-type lipoprotein export system ATPase subunit/ABC-type lipoprotein release transport system permease subunit [Weissella uvarum]MCM0595292.1 ATP-binding cassette domain-containing protein [Weissella uvarum]
MAFMSLRDIQKSYYLGDEVFPVLKGIDLDFELGEFVSILGESGGGKSTLMNIIGGLDRNFEGTVTVNGNVLDHHQEKALDAYRRGTVGYIYQSYNLVSHLSVLDNVMVSLDMTDLTRDERESRAKQLLDDVGLGDQINKLPSQLSGGQKQRVAIARALAKNPKVIIADEPTGALDSQNTNEVLEILNQIAAQGKLVIAVTHSQIVADAGTRIVHLADGKIDDDQPLRTKYPLPTKQAQIGSKKLSRWASYGNAFKHFKHNFWRNSLIILGTAIGLFAVLLFGGLGNGVKAYINDQVNSLVNPRSVNVLRYSDDGDQSAQYTDPQYISAAQLQELKHIKNAGTIEPGIQLAGVKANGVTRKQIRLSQVQTWSSSIKKDSLKAGHKPGNNEIVVDKKTVAQKYNAKDWRAIIGKKITLYYAGANKKGMPVPVKTTVKVSGVIDMGSTGATNVMNYKTLQNGLKQAGAISDANFVSMMVKNRNDVNQVQKDVEAIRTPDGKKAFTAMTAGSMLSQINTFVDLATNVLSIIAAISLVVSALMIIVTMYMSVSERTKEIGILRALGESKQDIRRLFTSESLMIGLSAALLSIVLGYSLGAVFNAGLYKIAKFNMVQIHWENIVLVIVLAILISFFAALLPARRASKLNPIDALSAD